MGNSKLYYLVAWVISLLVIFISIYIQTHVFVLANICWSLEAAQRFWNGGTYLNNFLQPAPPISMFIYLPVVLISKIFDSNIITAFNWFIYGISIIGFIINYYLIRIIIKDENNFVGGVFMVGVALVYFIIPLTNLGSRESLVIVLTAPYFLLCALYNKDQKIKTWLIILIGLFAGIGFCLKILSFITFFLIEAYLMIRHRKITSFFRIDSMLIVVILAGYLALVYYITPEYVSKILPWAYNYYRDLAYNSPQALIVNSAVFLWIGSLLLMIALRRVARYAELCHILFIAATGFLIIFFIDGIAKFTYQIPALSAAVMLLFLLVTSLEVFYLRSKKDSQFTSQSEGVYIISIFIIVFLFIPILVSLKVNTFIKSKSSPNSIPNQLISYIYTNNLRGPVYFFSNKEYPGATVTAYSEVNSASRFPKFWMPLTLLDKDKSAKKYFFQGIIEDFNTYQPNLVFIKQYPKIPDKETLKYDYINQLLKNDQFKAIWKNYRYQQTISNFKIYMLTFYRL